MKIVRMNTSSFWKGEAGVKGLVEDQGETFEVNLYLGSGRVRDYSCSCSKGNSYRGMCAHGEALFAYYNQQREEASKPTIHTSSKVHTMIREYTNREVALILAEEADAQVRLEPVLILDGKDTRLEFKVGITRFYAVRDLRAFKEAVENGAHVAYGKDLSFHHHKSAFTDSSKELLALLMGGVQNQKAVRSLTLNRMNRDRFFEIMAGRTVEVQLPGGNRVMMDMEDSDPVASLKVEKTGRDGLKASLMGVAPMIGGEAPRPVAGSCMWYPARGSTGAASRVPRSWDCSWSRCAWSGMKACWWDRGIFRCSMSALSSIFFPTAA